MRPRVERAAVTILAFAACLLAGCGQSSVADAASTTYFVTFSRTAMVTDIQAHETSVGRIAGAGVQSTPISPTTHRWRIPGVLSASTNASIRASMEESRIVCSSCQEGTACLGSVMDKPGCRR